MGIEQSLPRGVAAARPLHWLISRHAPRHPDDGLRRQDVAALICILAVSVALVAAFVRWPELSYSLFIPLVIAAGVLLRGRLLAGALVAIGLCFVLVAFAIADAVSTRGYSTAVAIVLSVVLMGVLDRVWSRSAGLPQQVASNLLSDLRRRHEVQTHMPELPRGWSLDAAVMPAHGEAFCGDVVVGCEVKGVFHAAVIDVSGKGSTAASRAVLLGGAVSGLLGALDPERVLPATNDYLVRQGWTDGFATATHVAVDLMSGEFSLGSAGHPAGVQFHAGTGRWEPLRTESGMVLGIVDHLDERDYPRVRGRLDHGDVLVLFSDGVVEHKDVDIAQGIDRMLGVAEQQVSRDLEGSARRICDTARAGEDDDRTVLVLRRD